MRSVLSRMNVVNAFRNLYKNFPARFRNLLFDLFKRGVIVRNSVTLGTELREVKYGFLHCGHAFGKTDLLFEIGEKTVHVIPFPLQKERSIRILRTCVFFHECQQFLRNLHAFGKTLLLNFRSRSLCKIRIQSLQTFLRLLQERRNLFPDCIPVFFGKILGGVNRSRFKARNGCQSAQTERGGDEKLFQHKSISFFNAQNCLWFVWNPNL